MITVNQKPKSRFLPVPEASSLRERARGKPCLETSLPQAEPVPKAFAGEADEIGQIGQVLFLSVYFLGRGGQRNVQKNVQNE